VKTGAKFLGEYTLDRLPLHGAYLILYI
jgi:hypothetical protein